RSGCPAAIFVRERPEDRGWIAAPTRRRGARQWYGNARMSASRYARLAAESLAIAPLATSAILTVFLSVAAFGLRLGMPLAYLLVAIAAWLAANYSFEILEHRATGGAGWAVFSAD